MNPGCRSGSKHCVRCGAAKPAERGEAAAKGESRWILFTPSHRAPAYQIIAETSWTSFPTVPREACRSRVTALIGTLSRKWSTRVSATVSNADIPFQRRTAHLKHLQRMWRNGFSNRDAKPSRNAVAEGNAMSRSVNRKRRCNALPPNDRETVSNGTPLLPPGR